MSMMVRAHMPLVLLPFFAAAIACGENASSEDPAPSEDAITATSGEAGLSPPELLGKRLFEDTNLSEPRGQSCASCHDPSKAFTGNSGSPIAAVSRGARADAIGTRNAPTVMYLVTTPKFMFVRDSEKSPKGEPPSVEPVGGLFWDGRANNLAAQAKGPFLNPAEMNNPSAAAVVAKVAAGSYASLVRQVYGANIFDDPAKAYDAFADAIATFENTKRFRPFASRFDDFLRGKGQLSAQEARGFELFKDPQKGNCIACHAGDPKSKDPSDWLFTDFTYDNIGVPRNAKIPANADPASFDLGLCRQPGIAERLPQNVSADDYCGAFKVPTLRNIEKTAPYMHNGYFESLRDVVKFYATRDTSPQLWYSKDERGEVRPFDDVPAEFKKNVNTQEVPFDRKAGEAPRLTDSEIDDVVAFLSTLTDR